MVEVVELHLWGADALRKRAVWKYALIDRVARCARRAQVELLAFGMGGSVLRLVIEGERSSRANLLRGVKVGTSRQVAAAGERVLFVETIRAPASDLTAAVSDAHRLPVEHGAVGPLDSPWSSHRDLLAFRDAPFYRASVLRGRVEPAAVHLACGGGALPDGWPPAEGAYSLALLLRVAAAVLGTVAADPACFGTFVQLARARDHRVKDIAAALAVTPRRVRQLARRDDARIELAARTLADPRLRRVP